MKYDVLPIVLAHVDRAEHHLVSADACESGGSRAHLGAAREYAREAGKEYLAAAHILSRPAAAGDPYDSATHALWARAAAYVRMAAIAFRRGLAHAKARDAERLAESWSRLRDYGDGPPLTLRESHHTRRARAR